MNDAITVGFPQGESATFGVCFVCNSEACGPECVILGHLYDSGEVVVGVRCIEGLAHVAGFMPKDKIAELVQRVDLQQERLSLLREEIAELKAVRDAISKISKIHAELEPEPETKPETKGPGRPRKFLNAR